MIISIRINNHSRNIDLSNPLDISIPLNFNGEQPNAYGAEPASSRSYEADGLIGDTRRGGSCNFEQYTLIPHCNGTHTECVGHITHERISVRDCLKDVFMPAVLLSVEPVKAEFTDETYPVEPCVDDQFMTHAALKTALTAQDAFASGTLALQSALIIRTLPNDESKLRRKYLETVPPYFTTEAIKYIAEAGFKHLLVDLPTIDRLYDEGKLSNHRIFWNVSPGSFEINEQTRINSTITELIYVPNEIEDGEYLLNLQIAPFAADAAPSRPVLFKTIGS